MLMLTLTYLLIHSLIRVLISQLIQILMLYHCSMLYLSMNLLWIRMCLHLLLLCSPFDASLLNEFTADTNSLASVLTASLVDVDADVDALADTLIDPCTDFTTDSNSDAVPLFDALSFSESTVDTNVLAPSLVVLAIRCFTA